MSEGPPGGERWDSHLEDIKTVVADATNTVITQLGTLAGKVDDNGTAIGQLSTGVSELATLLTSRLDAVDGKLTALQEQQTTDHVAILDAVRGAREGEITEHAQILDWLARLDSKLDKLLAEGDPGEPDKWTLKLDVDCTKIDRSQIYVYDGFDPANGQGPRDTSMLVPMVDPDGTRYLRLKSEPTDHDVEVYDRKAGHMVTFPAGSYVSAGMSMIKELSSITYGAVEMEVRAVQASKGTRIACLPGWPDGPPGWPSREEDFPEVSGDGDDQDRQRVGWNGHYKEDGQHKQHQARYAVNMLEWHTYRFEWTPDLIVVYIDGEEVGRRTENVPTDPMYPCIQTALQSADKDGHARAGTTPGGVDVKGWRVYEWTPSP